LHRSASFDAHYFYARFHARRARACGRALREGLEIDPQLPADHASIQENRPRHAAGVRHAVERAWAAIERRLAMDPDDSAAYDHGAGVLLTLGRLEESRQFSERAIALRPDDGATHYNAACCAALAKDYERSLDLLERAVELGYGNVEWLLNDNDLVPMHGEPRFRSWRSASRPGSPMVCPILAPVDPDSPRVMPRDGTEPPASAERPPAAMWLTSGLFGPDESAQELTVDLRTDDGGVQPTGGQELPGILDAVDSRGLDVNFTKPAADSISRYT
jgi:tetratricopeptide (TPR) repeat protein